MTMAEQSKPSLAMCSRYTYRSRCVDRRQLADRDEMNSANVPLNTL